MITCPNCEQENAEGALFCSNCGNRLSRGSSQVGKSGGDITSDDNSGKNGIDSKNISEDITLLMMDNGKVLTFHGQNEYSIGRISKGQAIIPDIDLAPYDAYKKGVSRIHACLKIDNRGVVIVDMGSANGTKVNGQRIAPNIDYPLKHADTIILGSVPIQIILES